jgi:hypothetical protein
MSNSSTARLCLLFSAILAFSLGCTQPAQNSGYCIDDSECAEGMHCDTATRRCTRPSEFNPRTDTALDRVLDMEIDAVIVDAMPIDAQIQDASPIDAVVTDISLVDEGTEEDATPAVEDASLIDALTVDGSNTDAQTILDSAVELDAGEGTQIDMAVPDAIVTE